MSIEQLIVLVAVVIAMLVRAAKQAPTAAGQKASAPGPRSERVTVEPEDVEVKAPARRAAAHGAREVPRRGSRREPPAPPPPPRFDYHPQPNDAPALRRAIVLATILGPPRALKDETPLDARDR